MSETHVLMRLGDECYALPAEHVLEVAEAGDLTALPGAGAHVLGLRSLRGRVVPVLSLAALMGAAADPGAPGRVCVASRGDALAGLAVDEVTDVVELPAGGEERPSELLLRSVLADERLVGVIDVDRLFAELERRGGT